MGSAFFGGLGGGLAGIAGAGLSAILSDKQAKKQRAWAERMSSTSYQRGMEDMRKAGLNPILAYKQGGASSPTGSMAPMPNFGQAVSGGIQAGVATAKGGAEIERTGEQAESERRKQGLTSAQEVHARGMVNLNLRDQALRSEQTNHTKALAMAARQQADMLTATAKESRLRSQKMAGEMPAIETRKAVDEHWLGQKLIEAEHITGRGAATLRNLISPIKDGLNIRTGRNIPPSGDPGYRGLPTHPRPRGRK